MSLTLTVNPNWPPYLQQLHYKGYHFLVITDLPDDVNDVSLAELKVPIAEVHLGFSFSYGFKPANQDMIAGEGLMSYINRAAYKSYYDTDKAYCLHRAGFKYEQLRVVGLLNQIPEYFDFMRELFPRGQTAVFVVVDRDNNQLMIGDLMMLDNKEA